MYLAYRLLHLWLWGSLAIITTEARGPWTPVPEVLRGPSWLLGSKTVTKQKEREILSTSTSVRSSLERLGNFVVPALPWWYLWINTESVAWHHKFCSLSQAGGAQESTSCLFKQEKQQGKIWAGSNLSQVFPKRAKDMPTMDLFWMENILILLLLPSRSSQGT